MPPDPTRTALAERLRQSASMFRLRGEWLGTADLLDQAAALLAGEGLTRSFDRERRWVSDINRVLVTAGRAEAQRVLLNMKREIQAVMEAPPPEQEPTP